MLQRPVGYGKSNSKPPYVFHDANDGFAPHVGRKDRSCHFLLVDIPGPPPTVVFAQEQTVIARASNRWAQLHFSGPGTIRLRPISLEYRAARL